MRAALPINMSLPGKCNEFVGAPFSTGLARRLPERAVTQLWQGQSDFAGAAIDGVGGDDAADALRYLVATKGRTVVQRKLRGL